jgi:hypothetical protein
MHGGELGTLREVALRILRDWWIYWDHNHPWLMRVFAGILVAPAPWADRQATRTAIVVFEMQSIAGGPAEGSMPMTTSPQ